MRKKKDRTFVARVRVTYYEEWVVDAADKQAARDLMDSGNMDDSHELEMVDWEIVQIEDNGEAE